ncbi:MAG: YlxR family protein [Deinococcales bacterium]
MKTGHIPLRRCVLCRASKSPQELIRFYQSETGWQLDKHHLIKGQKLKGQPRPAKPYGRGAWICLDGHCHQPKALKRFFKQQAEDIEALLHVLLPRQLEHDLKPPDPKPEAIQDDLV